MRNTGRSGSTATADTTLPTRPDDAIALACAAFAADDCWRPQALFYFTGHFTGMPGAIG